MTIHVVGNVCIDTTFRLTRFPLPGETLNAAFVSDGLGGKGANQAVAASRTGAIVRLWTAIGSDETAQRIRAILSAEGLDLSGLATLAEPSDRSSVFVNASGENIIVSAVPCATTFDPFGDTLLDTAIVRGDLVVMQGNLAPAATKACLALARRRGAMTLVNASPLPDDGGMDLADVDVLVVNAVEAQALTDGQTAEECARALLARGPRKVLLTLGAGGVIFADAAGPELCRIAAPEVTVVDTSGAGDVFCGVLAGMIACGESIADAAALAVEAASLAVTRPGTLASCPTADEIAALRVSILRTTN